MNKVAVTYKISGETMAPATMTTDELETLRTMASKNDTLEIVKVRKVKSLRRAR